MDPNFNKPTSLDLPPPLVESLPSLAPPNLDEMLPSQSFEAPSPAFERATSASQQLPPQTLSNSSSAPIMQQASVVKDDVTTTTSIADDRDLIEKEWVNKAKQIVDATKKDPYVQTQEMNRVRADYMRKRYNKTINISE